MFQDTELFHHDKNLPCASPYRHTQAPYILNLWQPLIFSPSLSIFYFIFLSVMQIESYYALWTKLYPLAY